MEHGPMAKKKQPGKKKPETAAAARARKKRQIYAEGHKRKFLVVVDETPECESALAFAASRALRTAGHRARRRVPVDGRRGRRT